MVRLKTFLETINQEDSEIYTAYGLISRDGPDL